MIVFTSWVPAATTLVAAAVPDVNFVQYRHRPTKDEALPQGSVFIGGDEAKADGSPRGYAVEYVHETTLVVEVVARADTPAELRATLNDYGEKIVNALLSQQQAWLGDDAEGIPTFRQMYDAPPEGGYLTARVQVHVDVQSRTTWPDDAGSAALADFTGVTVTGAEGSGLPNSTPDSTTPAAEFDLPQD